MSTVNSLMQTSLYTQILLLAVGRIIKGEKSVELLVTLHIESQSFSNSYLEDSLSEEASTLINTHSYSNK